MLELESGRPFCEGTSPSRRVLSRFSYALAAICLVKVAVCLPGLLLPDVSSRPQPFPAWIYIVNIIAFGQCAVLLLGGSRGDARSGWLGLYFLTFASVFSDRFLFRLASDGRLPVLGTALASLRPDAFAPLLLWLFARDFPEGALFGAARRIPSAMIPVAAALGLFLFVANTAAGILRLPMHGSLPALELFNPQAARDFYWTMLIVLTVPALLFMVWKARFARLTERRRVRVFVAGLVVGSLPVIAFTLLEALLPAFRARMANPDAQWASGIVSYPLLLSIPLATSYAVLVDQVLEVRLVIRNALQYALARYAAVALLGIPLFVAGAVLYRYRESKLSEVASRGGITVLVVVGLAATVGARYGPRLFNAIDRRFFREQYDSRRILSALISGIGRARSLDEFAELLTTDVDHALHLHSIVLLTADASDLSLVAPNGRTRPLNRGAPLAMLVGGKTDPLDIKLADTALCRLPEADRLWLVDGGFSLLVPFLSSNGELIGMLALGEKRSDLPFSLEDRRLLCDVAASAALALENLLARAASVGPSHDHRLQHVQSDGRENDEPAGECMECGAVQRVPDGPCEICGADVLGAPIPAVLHGKFRIDRRIGAGGTAVVYRALDLVLNRAVAIKTLPRLAQADATRLRREARAMAAVSHPNLALIFGAETWRGMPMLIVEYLERGTLADRLRRGPLAASEVMTLGMALADAMARVHDAGLLHRDIKPSNIGFTADGVPKLLDFGLAKILGGPQQLSHCSPRTLLEHASTPITALAVVSGTAPPGLRYVVGTPTYLSPEAIRGKPPDPSLDLWALALVMYEAIVGRNPFERPSLFATFECIARAQVPDLRSCLPGCSTGIALFLADALALDRTRRPSSARDFRVRLERIDADLQAAV